MYALNQTNSLYFFPHKLSFASPKVELERGHWLFRSHGSVGWRWPHSASAYVLPARGITPREQLEWDCQAEEFDRTDDDGMPLSPGQNER